MNIFIISDLHIDTRDNFGAFQWDDNDLIIEIEKIREQYMIEKVILNGDIFELMKYRYQAIVEAHPALLRYFFDRDFVFIKGNHDLLSPGALEHFDITNSKGQVIHIEHGHNADWFNGSKLGQGLSKLGFALLKRMSHHKALMNIYFRIVAFEDQVNHIPKKYNSLKYLTYALKLLRKFDVVVLAHTHKLESHHTYYLNKKKRYLNCGTCSLGRFQGIIMDTETLKYDLIKETKDSLIVSQKYAIAI